MSMKTKHFLARGLAWMMILALAIPPGVIAQQAQANAVFKPEELEQILAPIALYPDSLLSQVLMASTYPLEVVEAARWSQACPAPGSSRHSSAPRGARNEGSPAPCRG